MTSTHRPGTDRAVPTSTYRVQLTPDFGFADVAAIADYLAALGVGHVYLSPILQPAVGSTHGYDVVDHGRLNDELGGRAAFDAMVRVLHERGLRVIADVVPNHMTIPTPLFQNAALWAVLRDGRESSYADWFDIDWAAGAGRIVLPVLGAPLPDVIAAGELSAGRGGPSGTDPVVRYFEQEFPVRPGTEDLPLAALLDAQHYELASWRGSERLNFRRFFDVTSLIAVRVEDEAVFDATHALLLELIADGSLDGLRIDHPDGLADPGGYLARLASRTGDAWVVAEKILEGAETLPDWRCAGTTGYDALLRIGGLFIDPRGAGPLGALCRELTGADPDIHDVARESKELVVDTVLVPEVERLIRLIAQIVSRVDADQYRRVLRVLLSEMDRYRAYVELNPTGSNGYAAPDQQAVLTAARARAEARLPKADRPAVAFLIELAGGWLERPRSVSAARDFILRFQQTCGPVMAKGVEDTAFYRHVRLTGLNEVGGDPGVFGVSSREFHDYSTDRLATWPVTMTTLTTHDTKRSEDTRAMLAVLAERPTEWASWVRAAADLGAPYRRAELDARTEYLLWQTLVATWPIDAERLGGYAIKAVKEAKDHTTWTEPDERYEAAVTAFVDGIVTDAGIRAHVEAWQAATAATYRAVSLGQKLVQLTMPGVPDVYQGREVTDRSLVDPDNRRPVDFVALADRLRALDDGAAPADLDDEKLLVTAAALRLRREHSDWFVGAGASYHPLTTSTEHAVAFARGAGDPRVVTVATRLADGVARSGGWGGASVSLPDGAWHDRLTGAAYPGGEVPLADLLGRLPVALLERR